MDKVVRVIRHSMESKEITTLATPITLTPTFAAPGSQLLNGLAQGTGSEGRVGDKVRFTYLTMALRYNFGITATPVGETHLFRILIIREKCAQGAAVSLLSVFGTATPNMYALRNITSRDPSWFDIMYDRNFSAGSYPLAAGANYASSEPETGIIPIKLKMDFTTDYSRSNAGDITDIETNSLYLFVLTDNTAAGQCAINFLYNLQFSDL